MKTETRPYTGQNDTLSVIEKEFPPYQVTRARRRGAEKGSIRTAVVRRRAAVAVWVVCLGVFAAPGDCARTRDWATVKGTIDYEYNAFYGTKGVPDWQNRPGPRHDAVSWTGSDEVLYLFGGWGYVDGYDSLGRMNDLWRYEPASSQWTWLKGTSLGNQSGIYGIRGIPGVGNAPGGRERAATWTAADGSLYLFSGSGYDGAGDSGRLNDLWRYDPSTREWTWLKGSAVRNQIGIYGTKGLPNPANTPGARSGAASWTGSGGALYLFGGYGYDRLGSLASLNDLWKYDPLTNQWTWLKGSNEVSQAGIYGTQGIPDPANTPGGRRNGVSWTGADGAHYLFGGTGLDASKDVGRLNDLWKYDPLTNQWTWLKGASTRNQCGTYGIQGTPDPANTPGARQDAVSGRGAYGEFFLFGGWGYASTGAWGWLNDLWKYDPGTNQWTWLRGADIREQGPVCGAQGVPDPANTPGARHAGIAWSGPEGTFYLFGGESRYGIAYAGYLNDLWLYDPTIDQWAWVRGYSGSAHYGIYGVQGTPHPGNHPGAREGGATWTDTQDLLYLFGGYGHDYSGNGARLSDLWRYDPATSQWTWLKGPPSGHETGTYGIRGIPAPTNNPGARRYSATWVGTDEMLYLFGGDGWDDFGGEGALNDLWRYDPATNQWTWLTGSNNDRQPGTYGTQGIPDPANTPGAREGAVSWIGPENSLYLFGGYGYDRLASRGRLNDLWRYDRATNQWTWLKGADTVNQGGTYGTQGMFDGANTPGARRYAVGWKSPDGALYLFGGDGRDDYGAAGLLNDLWSYDPATNQWAWLDGANTIGQSGIYVTHGVPDPGNVPGARGNAVSWTGADASLFLFGGWGHDVAEGLGRLNDLWKYDRLTNQWIWLKGSSVVDQGGTCQTPGIPGEVNTPGARESAVSWAASDGALYLFGGDGFDCDNYQALLCDLWCFVFDPSPFPSGVERWKQYE